MRRQQLGEERAKARWIAVAKVTRPALPWREMYVVDAVGVALHHAIRENA